MWEDVKFITEYCDIILNHGNVNKIVNRIQGFFIMQLVQEKGYIDF